MVDGSLENATAVSVSGDFDQVGGDSIVDELVVLGHEFVQALLDHLDTVSMWIRKAGFDI